MTPGEPPTFAEMEERLYGADLDAFVNERTAAARDLRGRGERGVLVREERAVGFPMGLAIPEERRRPAPKARPKPAPKPRAAPKPAAKQKPRDEVGAKRRERAAAAAEKAKDALSAAEDALA